MGREFKRLHVRVVAPHYFRGLAVNRQATTNRSHAGPIVMMNGLIVSLFECDRPSKNMNTTTDVRHSTAMHVATRIRRARMGP